MHLVGEIEELTTVTIRIDSSGGDRGHGALLYLVVKGLVYHGAERTKV